MLTALAVVVLAPAGILGALAVFTLWVARRAERLVPPCGKFVTVDGVKLHVLDCGEGPAIVMLHGLAAQLQTFTYALTDRLAGRYRLILLDRPGCGYSDPAPAASLAAQADVVAALMRELGTGPAVIVGHSLGGAVALALALDHPQMVAGLALLSPATRPQEEVPVALRALAIRSDLKRWFIAWTLAVPLGVWHRAQTLRLLFGPDATADDFAVGAGAELAARPKTYRNGCRDLVEAGPDLARCAARYGEITVPVGVLYGDGDRILDPDWHGRSLSHLIRDVRVEMVPGGHMIPLTDPDASARLIDEVAARAGLTGRAAA